MFRSSGPWGMSAAGVGLAAAAAAEAKPAGTPTPQDAGRAGTRQACPGFINRSNRPHPHDFGNAVGNCGGYSFVNGVVKGAGRTSCF